jgi:hypothetical protein
MNDFSGMKGNELRLATISEIGATGLRLSCRRGCIGATQLRYY